MKIFERHADEHEAATLERVNETNTARFLLEVWERHRGEQPPAPRVTASSSEHESGGGGPFAKDGGKNKRLRDGQFVGPDHAEGKEKPLGGKVHGSIATAFKQERPQQSAQSSWEGGQGSWEGGQRSWEGGQGSWENEDWKTRGQSQRDQRSWQGKVWSNKEDRKEKKQEQRGHGSWQGKDWSFRSWQGEYSKRSWQRWSKGGWQSQDEDQNNCGGQPWYEQGEPADEVKVEKAEHPNKKQEEGEGVSRQAAPQGGGGSPPKQLKKEEEAERQPEQGEDTGSEDTKSQSEDSWSRKQRPAHFRAGQETSQEAAKRTELDKAPSGSQDFGALKIAAKKALSAQGEPWAW